MVKRSVKELRLAEDRRDVVRRDADGRFLRYVNRSDSSTCALSNTDPTSRGYQVMKCGGLSDDDRDRIVEESYQ